VRPSTTTAGGQSTGVDGDNPLLSNEYVVATLSVDPGEEQQSRGDPQSERQVVAVQDAA